MFRWTRGGAEDRWHQIGTPGGYEWWGFEALDAERELAFSLRISAGDPMDPVYAGLLARENGHARALPERHLLVRTVLYRRRRRILARTIPLSVISRRRPADSMPLPFCWRPGFIRPTVPAGRQLACISRSEPGEARRRFVCRFVSRSGLARMSHNG